MAWKIITTGLAAAAAAAPAQAETWWQGAANAGAAFVDVDSIAVQPGGKRRASIHAILPHGTTINDRDAAMLVVTFVYDCVAGTERRVRSVSYDTGGRVISDETDRPAAPAAAERPSPSSTPWKNLMLACAAGDATRALYGRRIGAIDWPQMLARYRPPTAQ